MHMPNGMIERNGTYYVHVRVPADIVETYGRCFERKSLRTKDDRDAAKLRHAMIAKINQKFAKHRAHQLRGVEEPKSAPSPLSFADLVRQHGRNISEQVLTIRADLFETAVANPVEFWHGTRLKYSEPDQFTYFDKLAADGDLDRVVGYIVRTTT